MASSLSSSSLASARRHADAETGRFTSAAAAPSPVVAPNIALEPYVVQSSSLYPDSYISSSDLPSHQQQQQHHQHRNSDVAGGQLHPHTRSLPALSLCAQGRG